MSKYTYRERETALVSLYKYIETHVYPASGSGGQDVCNLRKAAAPSVLASGPHGLSVSEVAQCFCWSKRSLSRTSRGSYNMHDTHTYIHVCKPTYITIPYTSHVDIIVHTCLCGYPFVYSLLQHIVTLCLAALVSSCNGPAPTHVPPP